MLIGLGGALLLAAMIVFVRSGRDPQDKARANSVLARTREHSVRNASKDLTFEGRKMAPSAASVQARESDLVEGEVRMAPVRSAGAYTVDASGPLVLREEKLS
jgi:hypothetical protein